MNNGKFYNWYSIMIKTNTGSVVILHWNVVIHTTKVESQLKHAHTAAITDLHINISKQSYQYTTLLINLQNDALMEDKGTKCALFFYPICALVLPTMHHFGDNPHMIYSQIQ